MFMATPTDAGMLLSISTALCILGIYFASLVADILNRGVVILQVRIIGEAVCSS